MTIEHPEQLTAVLRPEQLDDACGCTACIVPGGAWDDKHDILFSAQLGSMHCLIHFCCLHVCCDHMAHCEVMLHSLHKHAWFVFAMNGFD